MLTVWILVSQVILVQSVAVQLTTSTNEIHFCYRNDGENILCNRSNDIGGEVLQNIRNNSTVILCNNSITQQNVIHIANKTNISLRGLSGRHTEIQCHGNESGLAFTNVTNLTLSRIVFIKCGSAPFDNKDTGPWISAVWFYYCENVRLTNITVRNSSGTGIVFLDTVGYTEVNNSIFENNNLHKNHSFPFGGGVFMKFSSDQVKGDIHKNQSRIVYHNSTFINNSTPFLDKQQSSIDSPFEYYKENKWIGSGGGLALHFEGNDYWYEQKQIDIINCKFEQNSAHHGGGMSVNFTGKTTRINILIKDCTFTNNSANLGGGISVIYSHSCCDNHVHLLHTNISKNHAVNGGGGMGIGFHIKEHTYPQANALKIESCEIVENSAHYGGGTMLHISRTESANQKNTVTFINCSWEENIAQFGSAVEASLHDSDTLTLGYEASPTFKNCQFLLNNRTEDLYNKGDLVRMSWGKGVFFVTSLPVQFQGRTTFVGSNTSALYASSSIVNFEAGSNVEFLNNTGYEGGAVNLIGFSELHVRDNSTFTFENNTALTKGGAIMHRSTNKLDFAYIKSCFIRYVGNKSNIHERSLTFIFKNNRATGMYGVELGHTIYATTLIPCKSVCKQHYTRDEYAFLDCVGNIIHGSNRSHEISTDGAIFKLPTVNNRRVQVIPGNEVVMNFTLLDDENQTTHGLYQVSVKSISKGQTSIKLDPAYSYITGNTIKLFGKPGDKAYITVGTEGVNDIAMSLMVEMEQCPPGFVMNHEKKGIECVCSANTVSKRYLGILQCRLNDYRAYLTHGYWIGYDDTNGSEDTLRSGYCPRGFCVRKSSNETEILLPIESFQSTLNKVICGIHRKGKLCGSCFNNESVYYHNDNYYCYCNKHCEVGLLLYFVSEIIPVTVLFMAVIFFNVKFTSGALNGFIFFIQFIDTMLIDANGFISTNQLIRAFISVYQFLYRTFHLNFFTLDQLSFCLWRGANTLDILAFKYVTVIYSIILVILTVLLKKRGCLSCYKKQRFLESSTDSMKSTMIHGFSAFLAMCYSQCAKVTLFILTPGRIHSIGEHYNSSIKTVVFYHGDVRYMDRDHIKYALPALFFGITVVLVPPLLLLIYPLCYKVLAILHIEETRCINIICRVIPLENMKPVFDSFQSCFKDKYRFFAGLYFFYRLLALLSFLLTDSLTKFYIALEVQLILMLALQACTYPYYRRWHNIIDILLFADLAIINAMTMHNYRRAKDRNANTEAINIVSTIQIVLIFVPFICVVCYISKKLMWKIKKRQKAENHREDFTDTLALVDYRQMEDSKSL